MMKKNIFVLAIATVMSSCTGCIGNKAKQNKTMPDTMQVEISTIQMDSLTMHRKEKYNQAKGDGPSYNIDISTTITAEKNDVEKRINEELASFLFYNPEHPIREAMNVFKDSLILDYEKDLSQFYDPDDEFPFRYNYVYNLCGFIHQDSPPTVIAYEKKLQTYTGGAHGMTFTSYANFCAKTGKLLNATDIFKEEEITKITQTLEEELIKNNGCNSKEELCDKTGLTMLGDVFVSNNNFLLLKDSIDFVFNPYEIASYSMGEIHVRVSYNQIKDAIKLEPLQR